MKLQTERTMRNTFKCQHGLKISYFHLKFQVVTSTSKMNWLIVIMLLISLSIPTTGIPLEEGPVGGRGSARTFGESFNRTGSGLPTFAEGPTEGRRRPGSSRPNPVYPKVNTSDETINSTAPDTSEMFEIQHGGGYTMAPAPNNATYRGEGNAQGATSDTADASSDATDTTIDPGSDVIGEPPDMITAIDSSGDQNAQKYSGNPSEHSLHATTDTFTRTFNQAMTTDAPVSHNTDFYEDEMDSNKVTPEYNFNGRSDDNSPFNEHISEATKGPEKEATESIMESSDSPENSEADSTTLKPTMEDKPPVTSAIISDAEGAEEPTQDNEVLKKILNRLESLETSYNELQQQMKQKQISMSHEILLLKDALTLEQNKTKLIAFQMTHMMEAINARLINITQKWTHPLYDLTNYPMGAQGCRYSSFHRSGSVAQNTTSTAWAPNDNEAEMYMVTGAACSASIGARGYLERRTVPSKPELMQFRCSCTESRKSAVMRTCELHVWECFR